MTACGWPTRGCVALVVGREKSFIGGERVLHFKRDNKYQVVAAFNKNKCGLAGGFINIYTHPIIGAQMRGGQYTY